MSNQTDSNNPYQAYPNPTQSSYPGGAMNTSAPGVNRADQYQSVGPSVVGPFSPNLSPHFSGTTAMLAILSLVSLYEATHRVMLYANSGLPWDNTDHHFPAAALLVGGIWEALYSLIALFIALWAVLFDWHSVAMTTLALGTQFVGWYTVVVYGLAQPALQANNLYTTVDTPAAGVAGGSFNGDEGRSAYVFGWLLPLFAMDTALLAGIIFFTIQLLQIQMQNVNELHSPHYYARRLTFWSLLNLLYGVSTIIYAAINLGHSIDNNGVGDYFYPNFTRWGAITMISGILFTLLSLIGLCSAGANNLHVSNGYIAFSWLTLLWIIGAHVMGNCGVQSASSNAAGFGMAELGLFFGVLMIGKYLAYKAATIETVHRGNYAMNNNQRGRVVV